MIPCLLYIILILKYGNGNQFLLKRIVLEKYNHRSSWMWTINYNDILSSDIIYVHSVCKHCMKNLLHFIYNKCSKFSCWVHLIMVYLMFYSCVTWSSYHKNLLASSDYEGTITLWDAFTGQTSKIFQVRLTDRR